MKTPLVLAGIVAASCFTNVAEARTSSPAEFRGFEKCVSAVSDESRGLVTQRTYLINRDGANANYFINGSRWEAGDREAVRIECETANNGRTLLNASIEPGRWVQDRGAKVRVEVAQN